MFPWHSKKYNVPNITEERKLLLKQHCHNYNIPITDFSLWNLALTHISCMDSYNTLSYERLEFLGDSVLGLCLSVVLFEDYPHLTEGKMSMIKSCLVNEKTLSTLARELNLLDIVNLGNGERLLDNRAQEKVLCDLFESTLATIFLQHGFKKSRDFVKSIFDSLILESLNGGLRDPKTYLQKISVKVYKEYPTYEVIDIEGPDHGKIFTVKGEIVSFIGISKGRSKKEAEQSVAKLILQKMWEHSEENPKGELYKALSQED